MIVIVDTLFWPATLVLSKWVVYVSMIVVLGSFYWQHAVGGTFTQRIVLTRKGLGYAAFTGLVAVAVHFFSQVGMLADDGLQGALSSFMIQIVWSTGAGDATCWRAAGFVLALLALCIPKQLSVAKSAEVLFHVAATAALVGAFLFTGHTADMSPIFGALLTTHVLIAVWWFGALLPMRKACRTNSVEVLLPWLVRFGEQASVLVSVLVIVGAILAYFIIGSLHNLLFTGYGWLLMAKILTFCAILLLAARHKLSLVPSMQSSHNTQQFVASLNIEIIVAAALLLVTAVLTSLVGV